MRTMALLLGLAVAAGALWSCAGGTGSNAGADLDSMWADTLSPYLADDQWVADYRYDAGHFLMVPLHYAYAAGLPDWQAAFADQFSRFTATDIESIDLSFGEQLGWTQYLYLASRFCVLAEGTGQVPEGLEAALLDCVLRIWLEEPAVSYTGESFTGRRGLALWRLSTHEVEYSYYRAIQDVELHVFAIAGDLAQLYRARGLDVRASIVDILDVAQAAFEQEVAWGDDGGWLLQPGVWTDHPDYEYAGRTAEVPGMDPLPVPGIASDSSHAHRLARWLCSLRDAGSAGDPRYDMYQRLVAGLATQLTRHALVPPSDGRRLYLVTNYVDGWNGVYRWGYGDDPDDGYGPYELSGTWLLGWWAFLGDPEVQTAYRQSAACFPLTDDEVQLVWGWYLDHPRVRHPLIADVAAIRPGGLLQLDCTLAGRL